MMEPYFPMFINIANKRILVVGGGKIAVRRVFSLMKCGAKPIVIAREFTEEFLAEFGVSSVNELPANFEMREFKEADLDGIQIAILATSDNAYNEKLASLCEERGIVKNVSTDQTLCDFFFPSLVVTDDVVVGINSGGSNPSVTKQTRIKIQELLS